MAEERPFDEQEPVRAAIDSGETTEPAATAVDLIAR
jgi:hypothetical protein